MRRSALSRWVLFVGVTAVLLAADVAVDFSEAKGASGKRKKGKRRKRKRKKHRKKAELGRGESEVTSIPSDDGVGDESQSSVNQDGSAAESKVSVEPARKADNKNKPKRETVNASPQNPTYGFAAPEEKMQEKPNLVLISLDGVRASLLGSYGNKSMAPFTRNIDRLASEGSRFTSAFATPGSTPSRASLLTGRVSQRSSAMLW